MRERTLKYYSEMYKSMVIREDKKSIIKKTLIRAIRNIHRYKYVGEKLNMPWHIVAIMHNLECSGNFKLGLYNGEPWDSITKNVPKDKGPFLSWEQSAIAALSERKKEFPDAWTPDKLGYFLESYNGFGYFQQDKHSPYLWSFSNHGRNLGRYTADGVYDSKSESKQCGGMVLLKSFEEINILDDVLMLINKEGYDPGLFYEKKCPIIVENKKDYNEYVYEFQIFANKLFEMRGDSTRLKTDGLAGKNTSNALKKIFG